MGVLALTAGGLIFYGLNKAESSGFYIGQTDNSTQIIYFLNIKKKTTEDNISHKKCLI